MSNDASLRILRMVSEGKITAEQAEKLLEAIEGNSYAREITLLIFEDNKEIPKAHLNLPLSLAHFIIKLIPNSVFTNQKIPVETILQAMDNPQPGKIFAMKDEEGKSVEIYLH